MTARCVLVAGPGGTGCSTQAAALARGYAAAGRSVVLLGADPFDDATSMLEPSDLLRVVRPPVGERRGDHRIGELLSMVGLERRLSSEVAQLPETATARLLGQVAAAAQVGGPDSEEGSTDRPGVAQVIVIDAGRHACDLVRLASALPWILQRVAPAQRGWLASSRPLLAAALGSRWPGEALTDQVQETLARAAATGELLLGSGSTAMVCAGSAPYLKVRRVVAGLALGTAPVTAVLAGAGPGPAHPPRWNLDRGVADQLTDLDRLARTGRTGGISWRRDGEEYVCRMPLPGVHFRELSLAMVQDDLVLEALGHRSVLTMPTALRQYAPMDAELREAVLTVRFAPVGQDDGRDDRG